MAPGALKRRWLGRGVPHEGVLTLEAEDDCRALADVLRARGLPVPDVPTDLRGVPLRVALTPTSEDALSIALPAFGPCAEWPIALSYVYDYVNGKGGRLTLDHPLSLVEVPVSKGRVRYVLAS